MNDAWIVTRRPRRVSPLQRHRFVEAAVAAGHSAIPFPGSAMPEPEGARERVLSSGASLLLHGVLILALLLVAKFAPEELVEELIEVQRVEEPESEPAPRPRALAERMKSFDPAPMALAPQIVNPTVQQFRAPEIQAQPLQVADIAVQAPREIAPLAAPQVDSVRPYQSPVAATASPVQIPMQAPGLSGPVEYQAPSGTLVGPRQVVTGGSSVGIDDPSALGTGSSVREGIDSNRDVHGARSGERASVNVAVGPGGGRGTGGEGTGPGGVSFEECSRRPEVLAYIEGIRQRMYVRWHLPAGVPSNQMVQLRFQLDPSGSASNVELVKAANPALGNSAVEAMRAASPFDPMSEAVRCLSRGSLVASFTNPE